MVTCSLCKKEINTFEEGYFQEGEAIFCEKCYANKRWAEVDAKTKALWRANAIRSWMAFIKATEDKEERKKRIDFVKRLKVPSEMEADIDKEVAKLGS
jgi:hypothetical protein